MECSWRVSVLGQLPNLGCGRLDGLKGNGTGCLIETGFWAELAEWLPIYREAGVILL